MTDPYVGKLTYVRVYSGTLAKGGTISNSTKGDRKERESDELLAGHAMRVGAFLEVATSVSFIATCTTLMSGLEARRGSPPCRA